MYQQYFGLTEPPFSIAPDPRYLYLSDKHRDALAHLIYGVGDQGGFVLLTGEVGTGKTTICRCLLQQIPDNADVAFIINPKQTINQLLQSIFVDLHIDFDPGVSSNELIDLLNQFLLASHAKGRNTILIIDEAQNLSADVLEQLRLLTNLETNEKKLLQLVLLGQPELNDLLASDKLRQLAQRVTARYHLSPLSRNEVTQYIEHRLSIAGCRSKLFSDAAIRKIYQLSKGVPRLINLICDRSLLGVYSSDLQQVTPAVVVSASKEVMPPMPKKYNQQVFLSLALVVLVIITGYLFYNKAPPSSALLDSTKTMPDWRANLEHQSNLEQSIKQLFAMWAIHAKAFLASDCSGSVNPGTSVYCRAEVIAVDDIIKLNTPAVITLKTSENTNGHLLIKSIEGANANVEIGDSTYSLALNELAGLSITKVYYLSRIPPVYKLPIQPGYSGAEVSWLKLLLAEYAKLTVGPTGKNQLVTDDDASQLRNKYSFLYAHYLYFIEPAENENYSMAMVSMVNKAQKSLGLVANAIIDRVFVSILQHRINPSDPVLILPDSVIEPSGQES